MNAFLQELLEEIENTILSEQGETCLSSKPFFTDVFGPVREGEKVVGVVSDDYTKRIFFAAVQFDAQVKEKFKDKVVLMYGSYLGQCSGDLSTDRRADLEIEAKAFRHGLKQASARVLFMLELFWMSVGHDLGITAQFGQNHFLFLREGWVVVKPAGEEPDSKEVELPDLKVIG